MILEAWEEPSGVRGHRSTQDNFPATIRGCFPKVLKDLVAEPSRNRLGTLNKILVSGFRLESLHPPCCVLALHMLAC